MRAVCRVRRLRTFLFAWAMVEGSVMVLHAVLADFCRAKFEWDLRAVGFGMAASGSISVFSDLAFMPALVRRVSLSELQVASLGAATISIGLLHIAQGQSLPTFYAGTTTLRPPRRVASPTPSRPPPPPHTHTLLTTATISTISTATLPPTCRLKALSFYRWARLSSKPRQALS